MCRWNKAVMFIGGAVLVFLLVMPFLMGLVFRSRYPFTGWGMMGPGMMYGYRGGWWMAIPMIIFGGLIIWGIVALVRHFSRNVPVYDPANSALEILKRRYALGEINKEEFEDKRKTLT
jgi:putative membrane protein